MVFWTTNPSRAERQRSKARRRLLLEQARQILRDMTWQQLACDAGVLADVRCSWAPGNRGFLELAFAFEHGVLRLTPIDDTDEIDVAVSGSESLPSDQPSMFLHLLGLTLEHAWEMTNQRGYLDAVQMRFLDLASRQELIWQFEVAASIIWVREVAPDP